MIGAPAGAYHFWGIHQCTCPRLLELSRLSGAVRIVSPALGKQFPDLLLPTFNSQRGVPTDFCRLQHDLRRPRAVSWKSEVIIGEPS